ncbi:MAG: ABC transporter substrate-binding protein [Kofleriaceae bacterium]|nr:ABC transporter substrate-binding protein [Kofleriaceae bacterium]
MRFGPSIHRRGSGSVAVAATLALALAGAVAAAGCGDRPAPPLRIGLSVWPPYEMPFLARELGYLPDLDLDLVDMRTPDGVMRAYRNGMIDGVALTAEYAVDFATFGGDDRIILAIDVSNGADALVARADVPDLAALRGKRIGAENEALGLHVLTRALATAGLTRADVTIVPIDLASQRAAFEAGEVDAVVTYEPTRTQLLRTGAHELFSSRQMPDEIVDVLVMRQAVLDQRPAAVRALIDGWLRAVDYARAHPADAARRMAAREGMTPEEVAASFDGVVLLDRAANLRLLGGPAPALVPTLRRLAATMVEFRLIDAVPPVETLVTDAMVRER